MKKTIFILALCMAVIISWCQKNIPQEIANDTGTCSLWETTGNSCSTNTNNAVDTAKQILQALKSQDIQTFKTFVDPKEGARFSPYAYVDTGKNIVLTVDALVSWFQDTTKTFLRGNYDGSWEPINISMKDYFKRFVYDKDFLDAPQVLENNEVMRGNSINNAFDTYTGKAIIEFYISWIDPKYQGMDWWSLILVLQKTNGTRYLIGIVHNQWTI